MDLRLLRYFLTVAEERNFNRAAKRLHIAQPPLSRAIRQLEQDVGAQLLDRSTRPLKLTTTGRLLMEQASQIIDRMDGLRAMIGAAAATKKRRFTIGFVASTIYARLPQLIRGFRVAAPDVELSLLEMVSLDQISALKDGRIDVGFGRIRFDDAAVQRTILREERLVVAMPAGHLFATRYESLSLRQLQDEAFILYPSASRPSYADQVLGLLADHGIRPRVAHEARELQIAIGLVAAEEGICIVPESVKKSRVDDVIYRDLEERAVSPIIMSHRVMDRSPELGTMAKVIAHHYEKWGYVVPDALAGFDL